MSKTPVCNFNLLKKLPPRGCQLCFHKKRTNNRAHKTLRSYTLTQQFEALWFLAVARLKTFSYFNPLFCQGLHCRSYRCLQQQLLFWHQCALVLWELKVKYGFIIFAHSFYPAIFLVLAGLGKLVGEGILLTIWMWLFYCLSTWFSADFWSRFGTGFDCR